MIRHLLLISFNAGVLPCQINNIRKSFLNISELIPGITDVEWGENCSPELKNQGFTHCVLMTFDSEMSRNRYLRNPDHDVLKAHFVPLVKNIIVFDYYKG